MKMKILQLNSSRKPLESHMKLEVGEFWCHWKVNNICSSLLQKKRIKNKK
jgi:hypothetical protein